MRSRASSYRVGAALLVVGCSSPGRIVAPSTAGATVAREWPDVVVESTHFQEAGEGWARLAEVLAIPRGEARLVSLRVIVFDDRDSNRKPSTCETLVDLTSAGIDEGLPIGIGGIKVRRSPNLSVKVTAETSEGPKRSCVWPTDPR